MCAVEGNDERKPLSILLVDGDESALEQRTTALKELGHTVTSVSEAHTALEAACEKHFQVILAAVGSAENNGPGIVRRLRDASPHSEVLALTPQSDGESIQKSMEAGAIVHLCPAVANSLLVTTVEKLAELSELRMKAAERDHYLRLAQMDGLTELFNHRTFVDSLLRELERARRGSRHLAVLFADVDDFKEHNDRHGHLVGDHILRRIASRLRASCRQYDLVARYGGDEFAILAPETEKVGAKSLATRLTKAIIREPMVYQMASVSVSVSMGVAVFPEDATLCEDLLAQADKALYTAKQGGKGRFCIL